MSSLSSKSEGVSQKSMTLFVQRGVQTVKQQKDVMKGGSAFRPAQASAIASRRILLRLQAKAARQRVSHHHLCIANGRRVPRNGPATRLCDRLIGDRLQELADPEAARIASRAAGWQHMIRTDCFVRVG